VKQSVPALPRSTTSRVPSPPSSDPRGAGGRWGPPHKAEGLVWGRPHASTEPAMAGDRADQRYEHPMLLPQFKHL
jgi:hypothetical protein